MAQGKPIRVLQVLGNCVAGGVEAVVMNYYRHIDRSRVQFDLVVHSSPIQFLVDEAKALGANIYEVTPIGSNPIAYMWQIYKICKKGNYKVIEVNMNSLSGFALFSAWLAGVPVRILHNHTTVAKEEKLRGVLKDILRPFARLFANKYFACGREAGIWMFGKRACESGKVRLVYNAIDTGKFAFNSALRASIKEQFDIPKGNTVYGHVGRFMQQKNHPFLIKILAEIVKLSPQSTLILIGDGKGRAEAEQLVQRLALTQNVMFLGVHSNVQDFYNAMDCFIVPSLFEGVPLVAIEAQANGLPCLASDRISREMIATDNIKVLSLETPPQVWAREAIKMAQTRSTKEAPVTLANFDITKEAKLMTEEYELLSTQKSAGK